MSQRTSKLSDRLKAFSEEVIAFVETLSPEDWNQICDSEQWSVGATAYHLGTEGLLSHLR
jgi:hypothetical protein